MRLGLTVEAPIRVGGREQQVNKLEFVRHRGKLHVVSPRKLAKLLLDKSERTLNDWNMEVLRKGQHADLTGFLTRESLLTPDTLEETTRYPVACDHPSFNEFQPHARDAFENLFVPGSAIKGAIRSAVMWALVDIDRANEYVSNSRGGGRSFAGRLERDAFQSYELPRRELKAGPHFDLLRAVKVADTCGDGELNSRVEKITIQSYTESRRGRTASLGASNTIYVECLTPGSWAEFDIKVDQKILDDFQSQNRSLPFTDEDELLSLVRDFYEEVWSFERHYYGIADGGGTDQASAEELEKFPEQEEWIKQKYGELSKTQQRRYRGEYRVAREEFEAGQGREGAPGQTQKSSGVRDGDIKVGKIRDFYAGACPGFRLGWGSGLLSTTVDMRLDEENMGRVLNLISSRHHRGGPIEGPKSRKLVESERSLRWPMGWARLEVRS